MCTIIVDSMGIVIVFMGSGFCKYFRKQGSRQTSLPCTQDSWLYRIKKINSNLADPEQQEILGSEYVNYTIQIELLAEQGEC